MGRVFYLKNHNNKIDLRLLGVTFYFACHIVTVDFTLKTYFLTPIKELCFNLASALSDHDD